MQPQQVTNEEISFGASSPRVDALLPERSTIPKGFTDFDNDWYRLASGWFYSGAQHLDAQLVPHDGVDKTAALRHLTAIQRSWSCSHGDKMAGVAFLMSLWFHPVKYTEKAKVG